MSVLYPDESYTIGECSKLCFQSKTEASLCAKVDQFTEAKSLTGAFVNYHIVFTALPSNSIDLEPKTFHLVSRFRDLNRLHSALAKVHKQLYLRGTFPPFAGTKLIGATSPEVVNERIKAIENLFAFVFDNDVLRKAKVLHEFLNSVTEKKSTENNMDSPIIPHSLLPSEETGNTMDNTNTGLGSSSSEFIFPEVSLGSVQRPKPKDLIPSVRKTSRKNSSCPTKDESVGDLVLAAKLISTAQRAEQENEFELAFQCYKNAANCLIESSHRESDISRRNALRRKTARYLVKAEKLFKNYLSYDGTVFNVNDILSSSIQDPNILAFQCSNHSLKSYEIVGILPSPEAPRRVVMVSEKGTGQLFVMKLVEKGTDYGGRVFLPTSVPHMVQLQRFFETDVFIILLLEYVQHGLLWSFLNKHFLEAELKWLEYVSSLEKPTENEETFSKKDGYGGRRVLFSVGMNFERVVDLRDETHSMEDPSSSEVLCTMGEDVVESSLNSKYPKPQQSGDFFMLPSSETTEAHEESPVEMQFNSKSNPRNTVNSPSLNSCLSEVRQLLSHGKVSWPSSTPLPETLISHWMAQIVSWFYVMHNEHQYYIGNFSAEHLLLSSDGNILVTYQCSWYKEVNFLTYQEGYSAPESANIEWEPTAASDMWSIGAILFELITGRPFSIAAPFGVCCECELPIPEYLDISFSARHLLSSLLCKEEDRMDLDSVRSHSFFSSIDWALYDNPYSVTTSTSNNTCEPTVNSSPPVTALVPNDLLELPTSPPVF